ATVPYAKKLLDAARSKGMLVVYSVAGTSTAADMRPELAPHPGEPVVSSSADKFYNTELEQILKSKGIKTVIDTGVAANGAVLYTGSAAVNRGFNLIVPVETLSSDTTYAEQFTVWQLNSRPANRVVITRVDMIGF